MASKAPVRIYVAEEVLEIRYTPRGTFLNHIGEIADYMSDQGLFKHWEIGTNSISFRDSDPNPKNLSAFMSFRNAGIVVIDAPTKNFFREKAIQYWKAIEANKYFTIPTVQRIGVRHRCFIKLEKSFEEIQEAMFDYLCKPDIISVLGGKRLDMQYVVDMETKLGKLKATFGPLRKDEASALFTFGSDHFSSPGVFIDLDSSTTNPKNMPKLIEEFTKTASETSWANIESVLDKMGF